MQKIENWLNWLSDHDWSWWPLKSMRPPKNTRIDDIRILKMSCLMAPVIALLIFAPSWTVTERVGLKLILSLLALAFGGFFIGYKLTFAYCWNRRATRLRSALARSNVAPAKDRELFCHRIET
jgi:hypothetical protein